MYTTTPVSVNAPTIIAEKNMVPNGLCVPMLNVKV